MMELGELKSVLQRHLGDGLVVIIGSGLSCAEGMPGMGQLAARLASTLPMQISGEDLAAWIELSKQIQSDGLEAALLMSPPSPSLEAAIMAATVEYFVPIEQEIIAEAIAGTRELRLVFDMHGEYAPLCNPTAGGFAQGFRIAGPGDLENPADDVLFLPYWLLNREEMLSMLLDRSDQNAPNQASRFTLHIRSLKHATLTAEGKEQVLRTFTVDSPIPYDVNLLVQKLNTDNTTKGVGKTGPVKGEWEDKLTRFISRFEAKLEDRRYGFMFKPPKAAQAYAWLAKQVGRLMESRTNAGIKVVDFSEVPSDVLPIVTSTLARLLYDVQFWMEPGKRTPVCLVCDEAHLYLPIRDDADAVQRQALGTFERIAKEGRKYGFSLVVVSQRPSDVSRTILSQCNNFMALRLTNETDQSVIRRLVPDSLAGLTEHLPLLDTGEAIILGDAMLLPTRIRLFAPKIAPNSATREFWKEWGSRQSSGEALAAAVENLRSQTRPSRGTAT